MQPTIGIAIVSYNTRELLRACLESLRTTTLPLSVVVVDNASHDGSTAMITSAFPEVCLVASQLNHGFAGGTNMGLRWLLEQPNPPDYLLLLNSDTIVHAGALEQLVAFLEAHPRVGMVGPRLLNPDGSLQPAAFRFPTLLMTLFDLFPPGEVLPGRLYGSWWHGRYPQEADRAPFRIDHPLGACILVRRAVVEEIGALDEGYFMYAEEVDWCRRAYQAGWAIWQVPTATVTHVGGASTSQVRARMQIALYRSRLRYFTRHDGVAHANWHRLIIRLGMLRIGWQAVTGFLAGRLGRDQLREQLLACTWIMGL